MSRNRFYAISRYLHFNDNELATHCGSPGYDKLHKIRPILETVELTFAQHYVPGRELSIDEQMIGTKARINFRFSNTCLKSQRSGE